VAELGGKEKRGKGEKREGIPVRFFFLSPGNQKEGGKRIIREFSLGKNMKGKKKGGKKVPVSLFFQCGREGGKKGRAKKAPNPTEKKKGGNC